MFGDFEVFHASDAAKRYHLSVAFGKAFYRRSYIVEMHSSVLVRWHAEAIAGRVIDTDVEASQSISPKVIEKYSSADGCSPGLQIRPVKQMGFSESPLNCVLDEVCGVIGVSRKTAGKAMEVRHQVRQLLRINSVACPFGPRSITEIGSSWRRMRHRGNLVWYGVFHD